MSGDGTENRDWKYMDAEDEKVVWQVLELLLDGDVSEVLKQGEVLAGQFKPDTRVRSGHLYVRAVGDLATAVVLYRREQGAEG